MPTAQIDLEHLKSWIGRTETAADVASAAAVAGLSALLDHETPPWPRNEMPPLSHWLQFLPRARQSEIGEDGHPRRGGFLPPVPLPRRMWAGGRVSFHAPIPIGAAIERRSTIADVSAKLGASGQMVFVTVKHEVSVSGQVAILEEQDIVYRDMPTAAPKPAAAAPEALPIPDFTRTLTPDPVQLFRYSALTFNAHRIHYDREYCRGVEGYPGLVVHGPYLATLLMDHFLRNAPGVKVKRFRFRAQRPLFDSHPFTLYMAGTAHEAELWTLGPGGEPTMRAHVETADS